MDFDYKEDIWEIQEMDEKSQYYKKTFRLHFDYIEQPRIKEVYKKYISSMLQSQKNTTSKLYTDLQNFRYFTRFATENGIEDLCDLDNNMAEGFVAYLKSAQKRMVDLLAINIRKRYWMA